MSAFVVDDACLNGIITFLARTDSRETILAETGLDIATDEGRAALGRAMFELNCNAVEQRYGAGRAADFRPLDYTYRGHRVSMVQAYKSLCSWLYQCSEGDVPDTSLLYATMDRVSAELAHAIARNHPAYDAAQW